MAEYRKGIRIKAPTAVSAANSAANTSFFVCMLNRDTASVEKDFGLGRARCAEPGKSAPSAPSAPRKSDVDLGGTAAQKMEEAD